ncbi:PQQ-dependent sugar dehydrogenase [uncultured Arcticibacterium sp.]|uniref:PQQ-dependent sugar dehydrogenase n=1 Tax=uncultured Arcticibacterium sp. TaxID=2173042 RepID=UPI0030FB773D
MENFKNIICYLGFYKQHQCRITISTFLVAILALGESIAQDVKNTPAMYSSEPQLLQEGQLLFEKNCSSCHNFSQRSIGPGLQYTTSTLSKKWLSEFIMDAPKVITSGDARAAKLYSEYNQMMPSFSWLDSTQVEAILAFMSKRQKSFAIQKELTSASIKDPIPEKVTLLEERLHLQYHSTAPRTDTKAAWARLNKMDKLKGDPERQFIVDQRGVLYEIKGKDWYVALNIESLKPNFVSSPGMGTGFGSFAFHPNFNKNGLLYTTHAESNSSLKGDLTLADSIKVGLQWVLTEWKIKDSSKLPFVGEEREVLRIDLLTTSHGVQEITFNPFKEDWEEDYGLLYICVGDGGSTEKKGYYQLCADNTGVSGSILRIDPMGRNSKNGRYGIPKSNPYLGSQNTKVFQEIFCLGFRNPNRISWTPGGAMLINDIGQSNIEEINLGIAGADYGWPYREGRFLVDPKGDINEVYKLPNDEEKGRYTYPILEYDHDEGNAISGGFVYNGLLVPALKNKYVFSDITNGRVFLLEMEELLLGEKGAMKEIEILVDGEQTTFQDIVGTAKPDSRLGLGIDGELYFFTKADGRLYKVVGFD